MRLEKPKSSTAKRSRSAGLRRRTKPTTPSPVAKRRPNVAGSGVAETSGSRRAWNVHVEQVREIDVVGHRTAVAVHADEFGYHVDRLHGVRPRRRRAAARTHVPNRKPKLPPGLSEKMLRAAESSRRRTHAGPGRQLLKVPEQSNWMFRKISRERANERRRRPVGPRSPIVGITSGSRPKSGGFVPSNENGLGARVQRERHEHVDRIMLTHGTRRRVERQGESRIRRPCGDARARKRGRRHRQQHQRQHVNTPAAEGPYPDSGKQRRSLKTKPTQQYIPPCETDRPAAERENRQHAAMQRFSKHAKILFTPLRASGYASQPGFARCDARSTHAALTRDGSLKKPDVELRRGATHSRRFTAGAQPRAGRPDRENDTVNTPDGWGLGMRSVGSCSNARLAARRVEGRAPGR